MGTSTRSPATLWLPAEKQIFNLRSWQVAPWKWHSQSTVTSKITPAEFIITSQEAWQVDTLSRSLVGDQRTAKSTGKLRIHGIRIGERRATFASAVATMREALKTKPLHLRPTPSGAAQVRRLLSSKFSLCVDYI